MTSILTQTWIQIVIGMVSFLHFVWLFAFSFSAFFSRKSLLALEHSHPYLVGVGHIVVEVHILRDVGGHIGTGRDTASDVNRWLNKKKEAQTNACKKTWRFSEKNYPRNKMVADYHTRMKAWNQYRLHRKGTRYGF